MGRSPAEQHVHPRGALFEKYIELFVENWDGVTEDGKAVPYSFDTLMNRLPGDITKDWILKLGVFIMDQLGMIKKDAGVDEKNASGRQLTGSTEPAPSTASAKTAQRT